MRISEVFFSLQGEGLRAGTANIFIRFSGCNLKCDIEPGELSPGGFACDTEFMSGREMKAEEILAFCLKIAPNCKSIICTGGEPTLQITPEFVSTFKKAGYYLAIESNGTRPVLDGFDWISISPKIAEHAIKQLTASECKYVRSLGQGIPRPVIKADYYLISPGFDSHELDRENLEWCIKLVKENPEWRLSMQQHNVWKVR